VSKGKREKKFKKEKLTPYPAKGGKFATRIFVNRRGRGGKRFNLYEGGGPSSKEEEGETRYH